MRGAAEARLEGFVEDLAQGRVGVDHHRQVLESRARLDGVGAFLDEIGGVQPDDVDSNDVICVLAEDHLGDTFALGLSECLGVRLEIALRNADLVPLLLVRLDPDRRRARSVFPCT